MVSQPQSPAHSKPQTPCVEGSAQKLSPKPLWLQHLHFPFKNSRFPPVLLNLEISLSGASQAAASSNISVHQLLPLGWVSLHGQHESLEIRKILQLLGLKLHLGLFWAGSLQQDEFQPAVFAENKHHEGRETPSEVKIVSSTSLPRRDFPNSAPSPEEGATPALLC